MEDGNGCRRGEGGEDGNQEIREGRMKGKEWRKGREGRAEEEGEGRGGAERERVGYHVG